MTARTSAELGLTARTWSTVELGQLVAEALDLDTLPRFGDRLVPWVAGPGSGGRLLYDRATVLGALVYAAIPHHDAGRGNHPGRPAWHAEVARAAGHGPGRGWLVIDPAAGSGFTCDGPEAVVAAARVAVGLAVVLVNLDRLQAIIGGAP